MTVWGLSPFDDDDTIDFLYEIRRTGLDALSRACRDARFKDSRDEQHAEGFAAAYVVASILTNDSEAVSSEVLALNPSAALIDSAGSVLRMITAHGQAYLDRWSQFGEDVLALKAHQLNTIALALGFDPQEPLRPGDLLDGQAPAEPAEFALKSWQHQRSINLQLLSMRLKMKDSVEIERDVDHTFACSSEKIALAVAKSLGNDFSIEGPTFLPAEEGESECWVVVATKTYAPDFENTWGYTLRMYDIAYTCGADYDGWGAPIIKQKRSWFGKQS